MMLPPISTFSTLIDDVNTIVCLHFEAYDTDVVKFYEHSR